MAKQKTNVQFVKDAMEYSQYGGLTQVFIVEAITRYARDCSTLDPKEVDSMLINGAAWVGVAKELLGKLEAQYGR